MHAPTCFAFEAFPGRTLRVALFTGVANGGALVKLLVAGTLSPEAAFVNATMIADPFLLHLAAHKALAAQAAGRLTTRTLHSELVFNTSPTNHITDSLRRFGVSEHSHALLVARFDGSEEEVRQVRRERVRGLLSARLEAACAMVEGTRVPLDQLGSVTDTAALMKLFKPTQEELACGSLVDAITCRVASKELLCCNVLHPGDCLLLSAPTADMHARGEPHRLLAALRDARRLFRGG